MVILKSFYKLNTQNNCFLKESHKYDVYLFDKNKAHLNWPNKDRIIHTCQIPQRGKISNQSYGLTAWGADLSAFKQSIFFRHIWFRLGRCGWKQADFMGGYDLSSLTRLKINIFSSVISVILLIGPQSEILAPMQTPVEVCTLSLTAS